MKQSPLTTVLLVLLVISVLSSVALCMLYVSNAGKLHRLQTQAAMVNNNRALVNALANDALQYSKTHPAIDPILQKAGVKPGRVAPATPMR